MQVLPNQYVTSYEKNEQVVEKIGLQKITDKQEE